MSVHVFDVGTPFFNLIPEGNEGDTYVVSLGLSPEKANMDVYLLATYQVALHESPEVFGELANSEVSALAPSTATRSSA